MIRLSFILIILSNYIFAQSVTSSPTVFSASGGNDCGAFSTANLTSDDGVRATCNLDDKDELEGIFSGFNFTIPDGSVITGFEVVINGHYDDDCRSARVRVMSDGSNGDDKADCGELDENGNDNTITYGGSNDDWGLDADEIEESDIEDAGFGVGVKWESDEDGNEISIDMIQVIVYYTAPLPVTLLYFEIDNNLISWSTATEVNNDFFILEESINGILFEELAKVYGAGNSKEIQYYEEIDVHSHNSIVYYRLTQVDYNGNKEVFPIKENNYAILTKYIVNVNPNPIDNNSSIYVTLSEESIVMLMDILGNKYSTKHSVNNSVVFQSSALSSGIYIIKASSNNKLINKIIIVL